MKRTLLGAGIALVGVSLGAFIGRVEPRRGKRGLKGDQGFVGPVGAMGATGERGRSYSDGEE